MSRRRCCCGRPICPDCFYIFGNNIDLTPDLTFFEEVQLITDSIPVVINILEDWREISLNIDQNQSQDNIELYTRKLRQARRLYLAPDLQTRLLSLPSWFINLQPSEVTFTNCSVCATGACGTTFALIENFEASCVPLMWGRVSGWPSQINQNASSCESPPVYHGTPVYPCFNTFNSAYYCVDYATTGIPGTLFQIVGSCSTVPVPCYYWQYYGYPNISGGLQTLELVLPDKLALDPYPCKICPNSSPGDYSFFPQPLPLVPQQISFSRRMRNIDCGLGDTRNYCGHIQIYTDNSIDPADRISGEYFHCVKISGFTSGSSGNTYYSCAMNPFTDEGYDLMFGPFGCGDPGNSYDCSRCVDLGKDFYEYVHRNVSDDEINIYNKRFSIIKLSMSFKATTFVSPFPTDPNGFQASKCKQYSDYSQEAATKKDGNGNPLKYQYARLTLFYYRPVADCEQQKEADYCFNRGAYELGYVIATYDSHLPYFTSGESILYLRGKALYQGSDQGTGEAIIYATLGVPPGTLTGTPDMIDRVDFTYPGSIELK